jgi:DNA-directed RNA polymerase subunit M/transcription elongation factor TFIIS
MNDIDIQKEWSNLVEAYAEMSDEELCSLAEKAYELTDLAKQALTAQLSARKIDANLVEHTPLSDPSEDEELERDFDPNDLDLVSIARVWDADEAARVMTPLRDAGIPAYLGPDNLEKVSDFRSSFEAGVDIKVRRIDEQRALRVPSRTSPQPEGEPEEKPCVVLCPACKSDEVVFEELMAAASASDSTSAQKFHWRCDSCGHEWEDDGIEECTE